MNWAQEASVRPAVELQRKREEAKGIFHNNIRYAGDKSNRQAMTEALMSAEDSQATTFDVWLGSDKNVHYDVPVGDVRNALRKVGQNRNALITLEAQYVTQVASGEADLYDLDWSTPFNI